MSRGLGDVYKRQADRFADVDIISNIAEGGPVLSDSLAFLDCKVNSRLETPDHWIIYGTVENGNVSDLSCKTCLLYTSDAADE